MRAETDLAKPVYECRKNAEGWFVQKFTQAEWNNFWDFVK